MIYLLIIISIIIIIFLLLRLFMYEKDLKEIIQYTGELLHAKYSSRILKKPKGSTAKLIENLNALTEILQVKNAALEEKEELLNALFAGMKEGLVLTKINGEIVMISSSMQNIWGKETFQNNRMIQELIMHREFIEFTNKPLDDGKFDIMEFELPDLGKAFMAYRFYLESQNCFLYLFNDITDAKNLKRIKADFITNLSHELRTPLTAIKGYIEALEDPELDAVNREKFVKIVHENIERLTNIVSDLLVLSDIERTKRKINKERINLNELIEEVILLFRKTAEAKGLRLNFSPDSIPEYYGDRFLMHQLLVNLVSNALKFTEKGGVDISTKYEKGKFHITVSDSGIGIPSEEIPRIFERFYTVDKARSRMQGGTGLGLSIVKHIVQLHQGEIKVESRLGEGSKFMVILPVTG